MYIKLENPENIFPFTEFNETHYDMSTEDLAQLGIYKVEALDNRKEGKTYNLAAPYLEEGTWKVTYELTGSKEIPEKIIEVLALSIRTERDRRIDAESWKYERNSREVRLNLSQTDNIQELDVYIQALADITSQVDFPLNVEWPQKPE